MRTAGAGLGKQKHSTVNQKLYEEDQHVRINGRAGRAALCDRSSPHTAPASGSGRTACGHNQRTATADLDKCPTAGARHQLPATASGDKCSAADGRHKLSTATAAGLDERPTADARHEVSATARNERPAPASSRRAERPAAATRWHKCASASSAPLADGLEFMPGAQGWAPGKPPSVA